MKIRRATTDDVETLVRFNAAMARESEDKGLNEDTLAAGIHYLIDHPTEGYYLIAEIDDAAVGTLMVTFEWSDWRNGRFWWIQSVFVDAGFRRRGVYRSLHQAIVEQARNDPQSCGIRLYVEKDNVGAQQTYREMNMYATDYLLFEEEF
jgi:GNAT superfamily N-acetyltransferase